MTGENRPGEKLSFMGSTKVEWELQAKDYVWYDLRLNFEDWTTVSPSPHQESSGLPTEKAGGSNDEGYEEACFNTYNIILSQ